MGLELLGENWVGLTDLGVTSLDDGLSYGLLPGEDLERRVAREGGGGKGGGGQMGLGT